MAISLYDIARSMSYNPKYIEFIRYLRQHEDYKLFGKYEISKHAKLTSELLNNIECRYNDEYVSVCCTNDNEFYETQFQLLREIVSQNYEIPTCIMDNMDVPNKAVAKIWNTKGVDAAVKEMTKGLSDGTMDYATMRHLYG